MLLRLLCPFLYSLLLGCVWGSWFKKKFSSSLSIAFMAHILFVVVTGLLFKRLSIGIYGGIIFALVIGVLLIAKNRNQVSRQSIIQYIKANWDDGLFIYTLFYIFCFVINYGKRFTAWDEFSHWGMFLKESLRLDSLYCMSPLTFAHKDYVPAVTLFETIWCRLCGRYAENDVYRAIQIFMFSLLMPMFEKISECTNERIRIGGSALNIKNRLFQLGAVLIALLVPLAFSTSNAFCFYHSIYCDIAVGIVFFWCAFAAYKDYENLKYHYLELTIGIMVLVLSKMTAMALFPLVVALFIVKLLAFTEEKIDFKSYMLSIPLIICPVALWVWFNKFVDKYVENAGSVQSYDGMKLSSIKEVFTSPENSSITYLKEVKDAYIDAIIHRDILIHGSYVVTIIALVIGFLIIACFCKEEVKRNKILLTGLWAFASGVFYALLMYFLYCTAFGEYEAVRLASYERYMNSFLIAVVFLLLAVYLDSEIWKAHIKGYYLIIAIIFFDLSFLHVSAFDQVLPGTITHDSEQISSYTGSAEAIVNATNEDEKIYIVKRGDNGDFIWHLRYYCSPRVIDGGSIGPAIYDGDIWSSDKTVEEFVESVKGHDYIYFSGIDEVFIEKYSAAFENPELLVEGAIYRITNIDQQIHIGQMKSSGSSSPTYS